MLFIIKFAYNAVKHTSTKKAPFEVVYGSIPRSDIITTNEVAKYTAAKKASVKAEDLADRFRNTREKVRQVLAKA